jgi:tetratricopeptide (TPR) repeat protein
MTHQRIVQILLVASASFATHTLGAQCAPAVQRMLGDRQFDKARTAIDAQLKRTPNDDAALNCMGRLALDQDSSGVAVERLEKAIALNSKSAQHHLWLGVALRAEGAKAGMLGASAFIGRMKTELEQALALDPALVDARNALLQFYSGAPAMMGGDMGKAREQAAEMLKLNPMRGHMGSATIAEQESDYATAEKEFLSAITAKPDSDVSYSAAGAFYRRRERWTDAIGMYEKQLKTIAKDAPVARVSNAHYFLGVALQKSGNATQAKAEYQAALAANPQNANAQKALASLQ